MRELEEQLDEDLGLIVKQLAHATDLDRAALRVTASAVTRKWLIDKNLVRLGRSLNKVPTLPALDTQHHVSAILKDNRFRFYTSGGAALDGRPLNSFYDHSMPRTDANSVGLMVPPIKNYTVSRFLARKCTFFAGFWMKSEDVIRYVANKLGGVHYDTKRDKFIEPAADDARKYFLLGNREDLQPEDHKGPFLRISTLPDGLWDFTHIEMLAIAQSLCNVRFDGKPFMSFFNLEEPPDGDHDILLGIRNTRIDWIEASDGQGRVVPPVLRNTTKTGT